MKSIEIQEMFRKEKFLRISSQTRLHKRVFFDMIVKIFLRESENESLRTRAAGNRRSRFQDL